jgi:tRNA pseudouridine55 synthase|tara:strand:+ start:635 stop:1255 length:621 start_codon:yes stop_codon:yes gene_type:complete
VVNKLRYGLKKHLQIKKLKVGHAGTLDPLATGLLIICIGRATKTISTFMNLEKTYTGTITLGATTPSYDLETEFENTFDVSEITEEILHQTAKQFVGEQDQMPPIFSAKKVDGEKAYVVARKGGEINLKTNRVTIKEFELTKIDLPNVEFKASVTKGTYIRSLAYDFGKALNNGAHLSVLRRTVIGDFKIEDAKSIDGFLKKLVTK